MIKPISQLFQNTSSSEIIKVLYIFQSSSDNENYLAYQDTKNNIQIEKDFISNNKEWEAIPESMVEIYELESNFTSVNPLIETKPHSSIGIIHILRGLTINNKVEYLFGENIKDDWIINPSYAIS